MGNSKSTQIGYFGSDAWENPFHSQLRNVYVQRYHGHKSQKTDQIEIRDTIGKTFNFFQGVYTFDSLHNWPGGPLNSGTIFDIFIPSGMRCVLINHPHATGELGNSVVFTKYASNHDYLKTIQFQSIIVDWEEAAPVAVSDQAPMPPQLPPHVRLATLNLRTGALYKYWERSDLSPTVRRVEWDTTTNSEYVRPVLWDSSDFVASEPPAA
jgi:hypothetical protein